MNHTSALFGAYIPQHHRHMTVILVVMGQEEYAQIDSLGHRFVAALKQEHTPPVQPPTVPRTPIVTTVAVDAADTCTGYVPVAEDLHDLLACSPRVLVVPWLPETETDRLLDTVKETVPESVGEHIQLRPTLTVQGVAPFGPWGTPVNPQHQLDQYVQGYPGWHRMHTVFPSPTQRVGVLRSRLPGTPAPRMTEEEHTRALLAYQLVAAALDTTIPVPQQMRCDGGIYLNYLCAIVTETSRCLAEQRMS